jgi:hypothetical protein
MARAVLIAQQQTNPALGCSQRVEWDVSRARMTVAKEVFLPTGNADSFSTEVAHPAWMAPRIGVEWPLR